MSGGYPRRRTKRAAPRPPAYCRPRAPCSPVPAHPRSCFLCRRFPRQGRALHRRDLHLGQRAPGRGGGESPRPRRPADDLLQGRQRRCPAGQIGDRPFPRASHVQGHAHRGGRGVLPSRLPDGRRGQCLHDGGLHRLPSDRRPRPSGRDHAAGGRPDDPSRAGGGAGHLRARGHHRGAPPRPRQRRGQARRDDDREPLPQPSLSPAGAGLGA